MSEHYFTAEPVSTDRRRTIEVEVAGRVLRVQTAGGVFSPDHVDAGTQVLLDTAPAPPAAGSFLDLGCGWGPIALALGLLSPQASVWGVDVNERALDLARDNAAAAGVDARFVTPDQVPPDLGFDLIWSNPPIRVGKAALHDLLTTWLPRLTGTGLAYLVVHKNLGADSLQRWLGSQLPGFATTRYASRQGFRVLQVARTAA